MVAALSLIAAQQADGSEDVLLACHQPLDYAVMHPNVTVCSLANDMVPVGHSDALYLSEFGVKSRVGGHCFLTNKENDINKSPILTLSIIKPC